MQQMVKRLHTMCLTNHEHGCFLGLNRLPMSRPSDPREETYATIMGVQRRHLFTSDPSAYLASISLCTSNCRLFVYPFNSSVKSKSIAVRADDVSRLNDGEFLNDTLIEFGLRYYGLAINNTCRYNSLVYIRLFLRPRPSFIPGTLSRMRKLRTRPWLVKSTSSTHSFTNDSWQSQRKCAQCAAAIMDDRRFTSDSMISTFLS